MTIVIATSAYEAARPFVDDWIDGVLDAAKGRGDVGAVVAVDDLRDPDRTFSRLVAAMPVNFTQVVGNVTPVDVRNEMLRAVARSGANVAVFCDADDRLLPASLSLHQVAIGDVDFSYGDLVLVDEKGRTLGDNFFARGDVSERLGAGDLLEHNFVGFSNAAVRVPVLQATDFDIPRDIVAADWWLFSILLSRGFTGRRTKGTVANYRQHAANVLGAGPVTGVVAARRRCEIVERHYAALPVSPEVARRRAIVRNLLDDERLLASVLRKSPPRPYFWFEDVAAWIEARATISCETA